MADHQPMEDLKRLRDNPAIPVGWNLPPKEKPRPVARTRLFLSSKFSISGRGQSSELQVCGAKSEKADFPTGNRND
ncbi:hypothetical protein [Frigidibacter sp. SD6-1]|uniref:hypothetical protein n=1 Tax=Frigidibacter sp. SD6-1 TaxID=3032581 RepID=UPI0024DFBC3D|nr:hypothetical protein [Frigidibacter sp. SD6-1]